MAGKFALDKGLILSRLGGDQEIFSMMLEMFVQDVDRNADDLTAALATGDAAVLQREAHTIKGLLATFSDDAGADSAFAIEQKAKEAELAGLEEAVAALRARLYEVAEVLQAEIRVLG